VVVTRVTNISHNAWSTRASVLVVQCVDAFTAILARRGTTCCDVWKHQNFDTNLTSSNSSYHSGVEVKGVEVKDANHPPSDYRVPPLTLKGIHKNFAISLQKPLK
jgi:hypothetical protein